MALLGHQVAVRGVRPEFPAGAPREYAALARACWAARPEARPTFEAVLARLEAMRAALGGRTPPLRAARLRGGGDGAAAAAAAAAAAPNRGGSLSGSGGGSRRNNGSQSLAAGASLEGFAARPGGNAPARTSGSGRGLAAQLRQWIGSPLGGRNGGGGGGGNGPGNGTAADGGGSAGEAPLSGPHATSGANADADDAGDAGGSVAAPFVVDFEALGRDISAPLAEEEDPSLSSGASPVV